MTLHEVYRKAWRAEARWLRALKDKFGPDWIEARSSERGKGESGTELRAAYDEAEAARKAWAALTSPTPGHPDAVKRGCTCSVIDNHHGAGFVLRGQVCFYRSASCPLHGQERDANHEGEKE